MQLIAEKDDGTLLETKMLKAMEIQEIDPNQTQTFHISYEASQPKGTHRM
jgi:hypothetical protein